MSENKTPFLLQLPWRDPLQAFAPLADEPWAVAFISGGVQRAARWSILCAEPDDVILANGSEALAQLGRQPIVSHRDKALPFTGGLAGLLSYELGAWIENMDEAKSGNWPGLAFGQYPCAALFDHAKQQTFVVAPDPVLARRFAAKLGQGQGRRPSPVMLTQFRADETDAEIAAKVAKTIEYIEAGDIFQANISRAFLALLPKKHSPFDLFAQMNRASAAPFSAYFRLDTTRAVLSNSPERFLAVDKTGQIETHPIKGTRPRGNSKAEDEHLAWALQNSAKDKAENLMIVDLMRNDLSKVCEAGSVKVPELFALQSYANVHHLVSTVRGQLRAGITAADILRACFPPGSITGAPKIRAMQIIHQLEQVQRGPYCGALGYISNSGQMDFNVLIRTMQLQARPDGDWDAVFRAGGGIVADSKPLDETKEMRDKASVFAALAGQTGAAHE